LRDCLRDENGAETHSFWAAASNGSNLLPAQLTFDARDPRFYQSHVVASYPELGAPLGQYPSRVVMRVQLEAVGLDVLDDLAASGDLSEEQAALLKSKMPRFTVGKQLVWTADTATQEFLQGSIPVSCISETNLNARADKVPAVRRARCE
jgi:hypothetical protein